MAWQEPQEVALPPAGLSRTGWLACSGVLLAALLIPFFLVRIPPVLDYPNHLARALVLAAGSHDRILWRMYAPDWQIIPNLAIDLVLPPLVRLVPADVAGRLVLAGSLLSPLLGVIVYSRARFGRWSFWPLGAALVAYNVGFLLGLMNFLIGIGAAFLAATIWVRWRERRPVLAMTGTAGAAVVVFFCHIIALALLGTLITAHEIERLARPAGNGVPALARRLARSATAITAVFLPCVVLFALSPTAEAHGPIKWLTTPGLTKPLYMLAPVMNYSLPLDIATGCFLIGFVWLGIKKGGLIGSPATTFALVLLLLAYLVAPFRLMGGAFFDVRFALMIGYVLFAGLTESPRLPRRVGVAAALCLVAVFAGRLYLLTTVWGEQPAQVAQMRAAMAPVPPGGRVLTTMVTAKDASGSRGEVPPVWDLDGFLPCEIHLPVLILTERDAFSPFLFSNPAQQPLRVRPPYRKIASQTSGAPPSYSILQNRTKILKHLRMYSYLDRWRLHFDYVLIVFAGRLPEGRWTSLSGLKLLRWTDAAALYRVLRPGDLGGRSRGARSTGNGGQPQTRSAAPGGA